MGQFRRDLAREYAMQWAMKRNPRFPDFSYSSGGGGDCTNFVSQALLAGGWPVSLGTMFDPTAWWSASYVSSRTWSVADELRQYLARAGRGWRCDANELLWGDLVFIVPKGSNRAVHVMIVSGYEHRKLDHPTDRYAIYLCGHTNDRLNLELWKVESAYARGDVEYWKIADHVPSVPLIINPLKLMDLQSLPKDVRTHV